MGSPYEELLGPDFLKLDPAVQVAHRVPLKASGTVAVVRGSTVAARLLARALRLPKVAQNQPVTLAVCHVGDKVLWRRTFGSRTWTTLQWADGALIHETYGPVRIALGLQVKNGGLIYRQARCRLGILPLPFRVDAEVTSAEDGWNVHVAISSGLAGLLCEYTACLKPE